MEVRDRATKAAAPPMDPWKQEISDHLAAIAQSQVRIEERLERIESVLLYKPDPWWKRLWTWVRRDE